MAAGNWGDFFSSYLTESEAMLRTRCREQCLKIAQFRLKGAFVQAPLSAAASTAHATYVPSPNCRHNLVGL